MDWMVINLCCLIHITLDLIVSSTVEWTWIDYYTLRETRRLIYPHSFPLSSSYLFPFFPILHFSLSYHPIPKSSSSHHLLNTKSTFIWIIIRCEWKCERRYGSEIQRQLSWMQLRSEGNNQRNRESFQYNKWCEQWEWQYSGGCEWIIDR